MRRRAARTAVERRRAAAGLPRQVSAVPGLATCRTVAAYAGTGTEIDTGPLLADLVGRGLRVLLPVPVGRHLDWAVYEGPDALVTGRFGLPEPTGRRLGPDALAGAGLVLVPALAADRAGHRLGRGAGFYDRALASAPGVAAHAVVDDDEVLAEVPVEPHDRPVSGILTPSGWWPVDHS